MNATFALQMLTPQGSATFEEITCVSLSLESGMITILPGHAALVGSIDVTPLIMKKHHHEERFMLRNGVVWVQPDGTVVVKALSMEKYEELDEVRIQEYVDMILEKIQHGEDLHGFHLEFLEQEKLMLDHQLRTMESMK